MARIATTTAGGLGFLGHEFQLEQADRDRYGFSMGPMRRMLNVPGPAPDILSAAAYPVPSPLQRSVNHQLPLGFIQEQDSQDSSSEHQRPLKKVSGKRKSSKDDGSGGEDQRNKKQRGRPRLETQDETAADRRRTQIRLAQRAYRNRKETTIVALKSRVSDLQNAIEAMNKAFLRLHDNFIDSGVLHSHSGFANQLKKTTEEFVALAKVVARDDDDDDDDEEDDNLAGLSQEAEDDSDKDKAKPDSRRASGEANRAPKKSQRGTLANTKSADSLGSTSDTAFMASFATSFENDSQFTNTTRDLIDPSLHRDLGNGIHYTYSFQETSFSRRLHRMCIERGYRTLTSPHAEPGQLQRVFRFTLCFSNRKAILARFQEFLKRGTGDSLENFNSPFFCIGGAGTHFPRRDERGNPIYPPNMASAIKALNPQRDENGNSVYPSHMASVLKALGPLSHVEAETPRRETSTEEMLEAIGFGGEWFDSHDVEEYLKTKGIYLDGQSSFVEVDPAKIAPPLPSLVKSATVSNSSHSPTQTPSLPEFNNSLLIDDSSEMFPLQNIFEDLEKSGSMLDWNAPGSPGFTPTYEDLLSRRQQPVTFDVEQFLERLVDSGACLGRAPGFRRQYIDEALALSLQESF